MLVMYMFCGEMYFCMHIILLALSQCPVTLQDYSIHAYSSNPEFSLRIHHMLCSVFTNTTTSTIISFQITRPCFSK